MEFFLFTTLMLHILANIQLVVSSYIHLFSIKMCHDMLQNCLSQTE